MKARLFATVTTFALACVAMQPAHASPYYISGKPQVEINLDIIGDMNAPGAAPTEKVELQPLPPSTPMAPVKLSPPPVPAEAAPLVPEPPPAPAPDTAHDTRPSLHVMDAPPPEAVMNEIGKRRLLKPFFTTRAAGNTPAPPETRQAAYEPLPPVPAPKPAYSPQPVRQQVQEQAPSPQPAPAPERSPAAVPSLGDLSVHFSGNSSDIGPEEERKLRGILQQMQDITDMRLQVRAYATGEDGNTSSARRISLSRALSIRSWLMDNGIKPTRVDVRALGAETDRSPLDRADLVFAR